MNIELPLQRELSSAHGRTPQMEPQNWLLAGSIEMNPETDMSARWEARGAKMEITHTWGNLRYESPGA